MREVLRHLSSGDPVLARLIDRIGPYAMEYLEPDFETLVRSIAFQQLSGKVARVIFHRLLAAAGNGRLTPASVLQLRPRKMRAVGLSQQKVAYIRDLARRARSGELDFEALPALADEAVCQALTSVKGIGVWTAQMFLIFALRRPDVLPTADLGIRSAIRNLYGLAELPTPSQVEELARPWRPYATVASWYLWRSLEGPAGL
jgi:DNA-3-methyladenine glycosylase II